MSGKSLVPAIPGWHSMDAEQPHLIGSRCRLCGSYFFPKQFSYCKNPDCDSSDFEEVELSRSGTLWSYTNACYQPPEPFVAEDPFQPFAIAAVQLEREQMVILGQVSRATAVAELHVGMPMELVLEILHEEETEARMTWKWRPLDPVGNAPSVAEHGGDHEGNAHVQ